MIRNKKLAISFLRTLVLRLTPLLTIPVIIHFGGEIGYGYWAQYTALIALVLPIATVNLPYSLVRFMPEQQGDQDRGLLLSTVGAATIAAALCGTGFLYLFGDPLSRTLFDNDYFLVTILLLHLPLAAAYNVCLDFFRSTTSVLSNTLLAASRQWAAVLGAAIILVLTTSPSMLVAAWLAADACIITVSATIIFRKLPFRLPKSAVLKDILVFSAPLTASAIGAAGVTSLDRQLVAILIDTRTVGVYNAAYVIGFGVQAILAPFSFLVPAVLPAHWNDGLTQRGQRIINGTWKSFLLLAIPGILGMWVIGDDVVALVASDAMSVEAGPVPWIVGIAAGCYGIYYFITRRWYLTGQTTNIAIVWLIGLAVNLGLNLLAIPLWGLVGAAWATVAAYGMMAVASGIMAGWDFVQAASPVFVLKVTVIAFAMIPGLLYSIELQWGGTAMLLASPIAAALHLMICWQFGVIDSDIITVFKTV